MIYVEKIFLHLMVSSHADSFGCIRMALPLYNWGKWNCVSGAHRAENLHYKIQQQHLLPESVPAADLAFTHLPGK